MDAPAGRAASSTTSTRRPSRRPRLHRDPSRATRLPLRHIDRGLDVLVQLDRYLCLTNGQVSDLLFADAPNRLGERRTERAARAAASRTLQRLWDGGYVERLPAMLTSRRTALPYLAFVTTLTAVGAAVVAEHYATLERPQELRWAPGALELGPQQLEHTVGLLSVTALLARSCRRDGLTFFGWQDDRQLAGPTRAGQTHFISVPDGFFIIGRSRQASRGYFLELDLGTETVLGFSPHRRDWGDKIAGYVKYFRRDYPREALFAGIARPTVLTITTSDERCANLLAATRAAGGDAGFWFTTLDRFDPPDPRVPRSSAVLGPIWRAPTDDAPRALADVPR